MDSRRRLFMVAFDFENGFIAKGYMRPLAYYRDTQGLFPKEKFKHQLSFENYRKSYS